jgi:hypothetical protein
MIEDWFQEEICENMIKSRQTFLTFESQVLGQRVDDWLTDNLAEILGLFYGEIQALKMVSVY